MTGNTKNDAGQSFVNEINFAVILTSSLNLFILQQVLTAGK